MHTILKIAIKSSICEPKFYRQRGFALNINLKNSSYEGIGLVWVDDKEIGLYVSFYLILFFYLI